MNKIFVPRSDVFKAIERDCGYRGRQHITGWWYDGDDIAFCNNRKEWGAEHYTLIDFVAAICRHIPAVNAAKCNQFGTERKDRAEWFFFYRDEGATDCHSIPENPQSTTERAYVRIEWSTDSFPAESENLIPAEVKQREKECAEYNPYFDLNVLRKVDEKDVPFGQRHEGENCVYWVIPDEQMKRIEFTMWRRNQFAKVFDLDGNGHFKGYMDGALYTEDGRRIMLGSDAQPDMYTYSPAYAHVGSPHIENTHATRLG